MTRHIIITCTYDVIRITRSTYRIALRQKRTEQGDRQHAQKFDEVRLCVFRVMTADSQTNRQTNRQTHYDTSQSLNRPKYTSY